MKKHIVLENADLKLCNGAGKEAVCSKETDRSKLDKGRMTSMLNKASWNVICLGK